MPLIFNTPDDYFSAIKNLPEINKPAMEAAKNRQNQLTKPPGSLGRLEDIAIWMAAWQGRETPQINAPTCLIFAGNHGVAARGVSSFPQEVTAQMVGNFAAGGAAINQLCHAGGIKLEVIALELDRPTADFTQSPAMSTDETLDAMTKGSQAINDDVDVLLLGEMGIGNSTAAAALCLACLGGNSPDWVGPGTGVDKDGIALKAQTIAQAVAANKGHLDSGLGILAGLGGRELAAIAGATLAARHRRIPVVLDGFITTAAALPLRWDNVAALDHTIISHKSQEPGHQMIMDEIGKSPLLDLGLRLGEGSGAAIALPIIRSAVKTHNGMATFAEAGVSTE